MAPSLPRQETNEGDVISRIYLIRHGDRFDYANPRWADSAKKSSCLVTGALVLLSFTSVLLYYFPHSVVSSYTII